MSELFLRADPAAPWSFALVGGPALAAVAVLLVMLTLWSYRRHPQASRRRITILITLRILALLLTLLTAVRPSVGVQENPKIPSFLLIGVDLSESMTVPDELNNRPRIEAVRKTFERCQPTLDELKNEQNVEVVLYALGGSDFNEAAGWYDPNRPADIPRSDYAAYLRRTFERWQAEPYIRAHLVIGDGTDNGPARPEADAARWRQTGRAVHTFAVGSATTDSGTKDVALVSLTPTTGAADGSVFVKTDFTLRLVANAFGFAGATVPVKVQFDAGDGYKDVRTEQATLAKETDNAVDLKLTAPDRPGQIKVRVEVPVASTPGDVVPSNNVIETYLTVTKEGMRILLVNRANVERVAIRRALADDPRMKVYDPILQPDDPATPAEREDFDFDRRAYDVIILGNVTARQLTSLDPTIPAKIRDQVTQKGVGLLMSGGHATFLGTPGYPDATGWRGTREIMDILPVDLNQPGPVPDTVLNNERTRFQYLPTARHAGHYLNRLGATPTESAALWDRLNDRANTPRVRLAGVNAVGTPKPLATVYAVAAPGPADAPNVKAPAAPGQENTLAPMLVGHQIGAGDRGRVLAFAGQDTYFWKALGQPKTNDGVQLHARFWRQMVRWLAHQEDDDAQVFARPELPRLPVGGQQTVRIGIRQPGGAPAIDPQFSVVKILAPGEAESAAVNRPFFPDAAGVFRVPFEPTVPGEYTVKVVASGKDAKGAEVKGEAAARFLVYAVATDEMLKKAAQPEVLQRIAAAGGGQARRLDELPAFLRELKEAPPAGPKPRPRYYPDWRRDQSRGFLPAWLVAFVLVLGTEWGLRRYWGMV